MAGNKDPKWLQPLWEKKKRDTAKRVERAVKEMLKRDQSVTLDGIRNTVRSMFGISISANTIHRNEGAYAAYQKHRTARRMTKSRNPALAALVRQLTGSKAVNLKAKINRLRRESKDSLIAHLLELQEERKRQADREDTLREEIFRLHPSACNKRGDQ